jgi:hypothetical protein
VAAVVEATSISPRIASLHAAGALRGVGPMGAELARLHDWAELSGKTQVLVLALAVVLHASGAGRPAWRRVAGGAQVDSRSSEP